MDTGDTTKSLVPVAPSVAPVLHLLAKGPEGTVNRIKCRRLVTLIGSHGGCKIRLRSPGVSRVHVAIVNTGEKIIAVDLVTQNGTFLNDLEMREEMLRDGDVLKVDPWKFMVDIQTPPAARAFRTAEPSLDPTPEGVSFKHMATGRVTKLNGDVCTIGRRGGCGLSIGDPSLSRTHAMVFSLQGHPVLVDLLSENGLLVNGRQTTFHMLQQDDMITLGETQLKVRLLGMPGSSGPKSRSGSSSNGKADQPSPLPKDRPVPPDLIDIAETEGSQRWKIADSVDKTRQKR